jgi:hypothetical protein
MDEHKDLLNRLVLYLDILKEPGSASEMDWMHRVHEISIECKKIQIEIA